MSPPRPLDFYFEFASPYGYLASLRIDEIAGRHGRTVSWRPIMLGAAFKVTGVQPNVQAPMKSAYLFHDVPRFERLWRVELTVPDALLMNSLVASRAFYWLVDEQPEKAKALAKIAYHAHWGEGRDLSDVAEVANLAVTLGIDSDDQRAGVSHPAIKERLKAETMASIDRGVFSSPFIFIDDEPFWRADRLGQINEWLERGGW